MKITVWRAIAFGFFVLLLWISWYFFIPKRIKIYKEFAINSLKETHGLAWGIITSDEVKKLIEKNLEIQIPKNNFEKFFLLWSDGRRIKEIKYTNKSRFEWQFDCPLGLEIFEGAHQLHTVFIYKINRVYVQRKDT